MSTLSPAALPIAYIVLRLLVVLNWLYAAAIVVLLLLMPHEQWIMSYFKLPPGPPAERVILGLQVAAVLGIVAAPLNHGILTRLLAMVESVRVGDPFVRENASRLRIIAWLLLALQILSIAIGSIGKAISTPETPVHLSAGLSAAGWVAVLITFVLARVFAEGTLMRDELEGTI